MLSSGSCKRIAVIIFFFSSRRRHTRLQGDWSSDVCSSDLHHGWLQGWLRRRLGNGADAADLAQDTFVRILGVRDLAGVQEPRAYLTTVAKGVLVNWYKRQALERAYLEALAALPEPVAPSPEQRALVLETLHEIDAMLDALPPIRSEERRVGKE